MKDETLTKVLALVGKASTTEVKAIQQALLLRQKTIQRQEAIQNEAFLQLGDIVRLKSLKPKYLNGRLGEIVDRHPKGFMVQLNPPSGREAMTARRFDGVRPVIVPANCLEKVVS